MSLSIWLSSGSPGHKRKLPDGDENTPPKKKTFYKELNQNVFSWYQLDENGRWHCSICREDRVDNAYSRGHESPAKTTNHSQHAASGNHTTALLRSKLKQQQPMMKILAEKISKGDEAVTGFMKCAYFLAKRELPKEEFPYVVDLAESLGIKLRKSETSYTSHQSVTEFQSAIASVILEDKIQEVQESKNFTIMIDESTDIGNSKRLLMYLQYFHDFCLKSCLLSNCEIHGGTLNAEATVIKVSEELKEKGLDIGKMIGIGTDGASVMTGRKNGVVVKLRNQFCPSLVGVHCAAHRCALAASQASRTFPLLEKFSNTVSSIFYYFSNSALRGNRLKEIQKLLQLPQLKYAEVHSVRWLSLQKAVEVIYRIYPALCISLSHEATKNPTASGLLNEVCQFRFIAITHMLMDILPFLGRLSKIFQAKTVDFSKIRPMVNCTCDSLKDLIECEGVFVGNLSEYVVCDGERVVYKRPVSESEKVVVNENVSDNVDGFEGFSEGDQAEETDNDKVTEVELKYYENQKNVIPKLMPNYIEQIVENLMDRFQESNILESMQVLIPENILIAEKDCSLAMYGNEDISKLCTHFAQQIEIDVEKCTTEYRFYKRLVVGTYQTCSIMECTSIINRKYMDTLPNMAMLLKCCVILPVSTVHCERGFSTQNRIKTKYRTKLSEKTMNILMRISEDGPNMNEFDFTKAMGKWKEEKVRKIYKM